jgi:hypothetical protein
MSHSESSEPLGDSGTMVEPAFGMPPRLIGITEAEEDPNGPSG